MVQQDRLEAPAIAWGLFCFLLPTPTHLRPPGNRGGLFVHAAFVTAVIGEIT